MKSKSIRIENGQEIEWEPENATHLKLHLPGPAGVISLPVIVRGTREGTGCWSWNGSIESPTLKPSLLLTSGHFASGFKAEDSCWCKYNAQHPDETPHFHCYRCHTHINDGKAHFLDDCSHEFKGQILDLLNL